MSNQRMSGRFSLVLSTALAVGVVFAAAAANCHAQGFENQFGKAWRKGNATEANVVQLIVDKVSMSEEPITFSGKISIRTNNVWLPVNAAISGTCEQHGDSISFSGTAQASGGTVTVRGFYTEGADDFSSDDDQVFVYHFNDIGPENDPCDPDDEILIEGLEEPLP